MEFIARTQDEKIVRYKDPKRYAWLTAFFSPFLGLAMVLLYLAVGAQSWVLFLRSRWAAVSFIASAVS